MSVQTELEELISRRPETAEDAEQVAAAAALLADYHRLEARVRALVERSRRSRAPGGSLAGLTLHEAAERVLADAGMPLHASELGCRMKAAGWRHPRTRNAPPQQIEHQLAARLPHYEAFQRVSPQTFALTRWDGSYPGGRQRAKVPTAMFHGSGDAVAAGASVANDPITSEDAAWRSS